MEENKEDSDSPYRKETSENQIMQEQYIAELFKKFTCDIGVDNLGYGTNQDNTG